MQKDNIIVPGIEQVDAVKQISSEVFMKVVAADSCNGRMAKGSKLKKLMRNQVVNLRLGPRQLLLGSLKLQKKKKHKRTKRMASVCFSGDNTNDQQASTSSSSTTTTTMPPKNVECTSRKRKHSSASANSENDTQALKDIQQVVGTSCAGVGDHNIDIKNKKSANFASANLPELDSSSSANQAQSRKNIEAKKVATSQHVGILTRDLMAEVTG
jgi:ubiquitin carboxyl-terminal hydrolase 36/42